MTPDKEERFPLSIEACTCVCMLFLISSLYGSRPLPQRILCHWPLQSLVSSAFILYFDTRHSAAGCPRDTSQGGGREVTGNPFPCQAVPEMLALSSSKPATACLQPQSPPVPPTPQHMTCCFPPAGLTPLLFFF